MDRKEASDYIRSNPKQYLREAKKRNTYICPLCGNGTGSQGDGMTTKDGVHFTCWKCNQVRNADILDIIGLEYGLSEYPDKLNKAMDLYNISQDEAPVKHHSATIAPTQNKGDNMSEEKTIKADYTSLAYA